MKPTTPGKNSPLGTILLTLAVLIIASGWLYFTHPELNFKNPGAVLMALVLIGIISLIATLKKTRLITTRTVQTPFGRKTVRTLELKALRTTRFHFLLALLFIAYLVIGGLTGAHIFRAKDYAAQMPIEVLQPEDFAAEVTPQSIGNSTLPVIDKDISLRKAEGKLSTYGSQFSISDSFTLIHINQDGAERLVRVAPLEYNGFFVALNHFKTGSAGYIMVDVVTEEAQLVEVPEGIHYLESGLFNYNLSRHVWMSNPTALVTDYSFEIDDSGAPYWVATVYDNQIGLFSGQTPVGIILVNAVTGETRRYGMDEIPDWVDRVVPVEQAVTQATNALTYINGWFNATIGAKRDVFRLADEYNYLSLDGKTYLYSGVTSPNDADETSVGFMLIDLKTRAARMYRIQGVTEYRAMEIASSHQSVKAQNLTPTVPILINIEGQPTYFLILKNNVQRQWYVLIRVSDGAMVLNQDLKSCKTEYISLLSSQGGTISAGLESLQGRVLRVRASGADTLEFVFANKLDKIFMAPLSLGIDVRFLQAGDEVTVKYLPSDDGTCLVRELENLTLHNQPQLEPIQ